MLLSDLITHTQSVLPLFTDKFTTNKTITTISKSGDDVTVTVAGHGLSVNDKVIISNVKTDVALSSITNDLTVSSITRSGNVATVTTSGNHYLNNNDQVIMAGADQTDYNGTFKVTVKTATTFTYLVDSGATTPATGTITAKVNNIATATASSDHDLTEKYSKKVALTSTESSYNGTFEISDIIDKTIFRFKMTGTATASTGTLSTFHSQGFNGVQTVTEVVDTNNFKYVLDNDGISAGSGSTMKMMTRPRITGAATLQRAIDSYTKKNESELWAFWTFDQGTDADNNRNVNNDSINERIKGSDMKTRMINNPTLYLFIPTHKTDLSGRAAIDEARQLSVPLYKTLVDYVPEQVYVSEIQTVLMPTGHEPVDFDEIPAYLVYRFRFQATEFLSNASSEQDPTEFMSGTGDGVGVLNNRAFRLFNFKIDNSQNVIIKNDEFDIKE